jgi:hypothetical protein
VLAVIVDQFAIGSPTLTILGEVFVMFRNSESLAAEG